MTDSLRERLEAAELTRVGILAEPEDKSRIAADRALGVVRQFWNDHRDELGAELDLRRKSDRPYALARLERVLFGTSPDEEPCAECGGTGLVADGLPSNGPAPCECRRVTQ